MLLLAHSKYIAIVNQSVTLVTNCCRIRLVGKDKEPLDLTQDKHLEVFQKSMEQWGKEMGEDKNNSKYGYVDILGTELKPYGTPYASA